MPAHRHVCYCGDDWLCTKRDCDIPVVTDCTRCADTQYERWARSSGYLDITDREDDHESWGSLYGRVSES